MDAKHNTTQREHRETRISDVDGNEWTGMEQKVNTLELALFVAHTIKQPGLSFPRSFREKLVRFTSTSWFLGLINTPAQVTYFQQWFWDTSHSHIHIWGHFEPPIDLNTHVFGLWDETVERGQNPQRELKIRLCSHSIWCCLNELWCASQFKSSLLSLVWNAVIWALSGTKQRSYQHKHMKVKPSFE